MSTTRLVRESNPPDGRIASPVPQYKNVSTGEYEDAKGSSGAILVQALTTTIVDLKSLLDNFGEVQASPTANTLLERIKVIKTELDVIQTQLGDTTDVVVAAGAVGSLAAKLRRLTADLGAEIIQIGDTDAALVNAGAVGSLSAKMRRLTTDLDAFKTNFDAEVGMSVYSNSAPGAHAGETIGMTHLNITDGDLYVSTGAAWVLKLEDIWV